MYGYLKVDGRHGRGRASHAQCGLCAHFGRSYRTRTRLLAGMDASVLLLLVEGMSDQPLDRDRVRCPLKLGLRHRVALGPDTDAVALVAALQLFLAGEKLVDDRVDRDSRTAKVAAALFAKDVAESERRLVDAGFPLQAVRLELRAQSALEADRSADIDALSGPTARGLGAIARWLASRFSASASAVDAMATFGARLGTTIYLVDAIDDVAHDLASNSFNPLMQTLGGLTPASLDYLGGLVEGRLEALASAFDALELTRNTEVLREATVESLRREAERALKKLPAPAVAMRQLALPQPSPHSSTHSGATDARV